MLRYRACVVALSCTCTSNHRSAHTPTVTFPARGSMYEPVSLLASISVSRRSASPLSRNVAVRSLPVSGLT